MLRPDEGPPPSKEEKKHTKRSSGGESGERKFLERIGHGRGSITKKGKKAREVLADYILKRNPTRRSQMQIAWNFGTRKKRAVRGVNGTEVAAD